MSSQRTHVAMCASRLKRTCTCVSDRGTPGGDHGAGNRSVGGRCQDAGPWGRTIVRAAPPNEAPQGSAEVLCVPEDQLPTAAVELTLAFAAERPIPLPVSKTHQASGGCVVSRPSDASSGCCWPGVGTGPYSSCRAGTDQSPVPGSPQAG